MIKFTIFLLLSIKLFASNQFYYEFDKKVEVLPSIQSFSQNNENSTILQYTTIDGKTLRFKNEILVTCKKNRYCEDDFIDLNITNFEKISKNLFLIILTSQDNIFEICQNLYIKEDIKSAHPNYQREIIAK